MKKFFSWENLQWVNRMTLSVVLIYGMLTGCTLRLSIPATKDEKPRIVVLPVSPLPDNGIEVHVVSIKVIPTNQITSIPQLSDFQMQRVSLDEVPEDLKNEILQISNFLAGHIEDMPEDIKNTVSHPSNVEIVYENTIPFLYDRGNFLWLEEDKMHRQIMRKIAEKSMLRDQEAISNKIWNFSEYSFDVNTDESESAKEFRKTFLYETLVKQSPTGKIEYTNLSVGAISNLVARYMVPRFKEALMKNLEEVVEEVKTHEATIAYEEMNTPPSTTLYEETTNYSIHRVPKELHCYKDVLPYPDFLEVKDPPPQHLSSEPYGFVIKNSSNTVAYFIVDLTNYMRENGVSIEKLRQLDGRFYGSIQDTLELAARIKDFSNNFYQVYKNSDGVISITTNTWSYTMTQEPWTTYYHTNFVTNKAYSFESWMAMKYGIFMFPLYQVIQVCHQYTSWWPWKTIDGSLPFLVYDTVVIYRYTNVNGVEYSVYTNWLGMITAFPPVTGEQMTIRFARASEYCITRTTNGHSYTTNIIVDLYPEEFTNNGVVYVPFNRTVDWIYSNARDGDIIWCEYDQPISPLGGHSGVIIKPGELKTIKINGSRTLDRIGVLTAFGHEKDGAVGLITGSSSSSSTPPGWKNTVYRLDGGKADCVHFYNLEGHAINTWEGGILRVKEKTPGEGRLRVEKAFEKYGGAPYNLAINVSKQNLNRETGMYCNAITWKTWSEEVRDENGQIYTGVDIDEVPTEVTYANVASLLTWLGMGLAWGGFGVVSLSVSFALGGFLIVVGLLIIGLGSFLVWLASQRYSWDTVSVRDMLASSKVQKICQWGR
ncbi:hypothetical protein BREVNS_0019 [Brevinematales bacterium NS]|nr:hypothetical protein [Brevinematales bacterium]QJR20769.1 hypothetical protein BREVNS_0019 [Brevinematales bacterium NS]